jgi:hypothetical protein
LIGDQEQGEMPKLTEVDYDPFAEDAPVAPPCSGISAISFAAATLHLRDTPLGMLTAAEAARQ